MLANNIQRRGNFSLRYCRPTVGYALSIIVNEQKLHKFAYFVLVSHGKSFDKILKTGSV